MASTILKSLLILSTLLLISSTSSDYTSQLRHFCKSTPFPDSCFHSLNLNSIPEPNALNFLLYSLKFAISEGLKLSVLLSNAAHPNVVEKLRGTVQDCRELHEITLSSLKESLTWITSPRSRNPSDARTFLSAAVTNGITCLEGLNSAAGPLKPALVSSLSSTYEHIGNSLSMLMSPLRKPPGLGGRSRRLLGHPRWLSEKDRRILQSSAEVYGASEILTVAVDGSGNFSTVTEAVKFAPNNSAERVIIYVKAGEYEENVEIPIWKTNIVVIGDGSDVTVIRGRRSVGDGWTTFRSASFAVSGNGFLARDIAFENAAGPEKHQAVALRVNADLTAVYKCIINGYQDSLYVHSFRQFYRECDIYGTVDYIFGNAAVIFQACNIVSRMPMPGQYTVITAQSRDAPYQNTGISFQNCTVLATDELQSNSGAVRSYLGRPWRNYSRTVFMESYIDDFVSGEGWTGWSGGGGVDTLYYGEYRNNGPGSSTGGRVSWKGHRVMDYVDASNFTVSEFINGGEWLASTCFPFDDGV